MFALVAEYFSSLGHFICTCESCIIRTRCGKLKSRLSYLDHLKLEFFVTFDQLFQDCDLIFDQEWSDQVRHELKLKAESDDRKSGLVKLPGGEQAVNFRDVGCWVVSKAKNTMIRIEKQ